jgi:hypothetical protein
MVVFPVDLKAKKHLALFLRTNSQSSLHLLVLIQKFQITRLYAQMQCVHFKTKLKFHFVIRQVNKTLNKVHRR